MTNEEKATQLSQKHYHEDNVWARVIWKSACMEMAELKDKAFLSIIEDKLNYARDMIKENHGKSVRLKYEGMRKILIEIKNELNAK